MLNKLNMQKTALKRDRQMVERFVGISWPLLGRRKPSGGFSNEVRLSTDDFHYSQDRFIQRGLIFPSEQWEQFVPNEISLNIERGIRSVLAKSYFIGGGIIEQGGFRLIQEWTDEINFWIRRRR